MATVNCPHCRGTYSVAIVPTRCRECGKPLPSTASSGDDLSLSLKELRSCPSCRQDSYEDEFSDGCCPKCGAHAEEEEEEEEDDEDDEPRGRGRRGKAPRRGGRKRPSGAGRRTGARRSVGGGLSKSGKRKSVGKAAPPPPPQKRTITLTEEFKTQVYDAFKWANAQQAQQLCFELTEGNEDHARQIYGHLLGVAKKNNWIGLYKNQPPGGPPPGPAPAAPPVAAGPPPGAPLEPLPLPAGILSPGGAPPPGMPLEPLPLPAGILGGPGGIGEDSANTVQLPPEVASGRVPALGGNLEHSLDEESIPTVNLGGNQLLPPMPPPMPEPFAASAPTVQLPPPQIPAPVAEPAAAPSDQEPEERGFLGRVAIEGRAAQVTLLCHAGRYAAGRDLAQSTLVRDPYAPRGHAALGEAMAGLGEDAQALQAFTNAVRADPDDPVCVRGYAQILTRLGRHQEAIAAYRRIVGPGKGALKDAVALADVLRKVGDAQGAQRVLDEVYKRDPQSLVPLRQQAETRASQGDMDGAADLLEQMLAKERPPYTQSQALAESLAPRCGLSTKARLTCGKAFTLVGRPLSAVRLLAPVVARSPGDLAARRTLGLAYARLGAGPQAEEQLLGVAQRGQGDAEVFGALGEVYLERGDSASGIKALERARDARPQDVSLRRALARALAAQGDLDGAIRELEQAGKLAGSDDDTLEDELVRITERAYTKRIKELEARLMSDEEDSQARLQLGVALAQRGDLGLAIDHLQRVSRKRAFAAQALTKAEHIDAEYVEGPTPRALVLLLVDLYEQAGQLEGAIQRCERHLETSPEDAELRLRLLGLFARCHRIQDAASGLEGLLEETSSAHLEGAVRLGESLLEKERCTSLAHPLARARRHLGDVAGAQAHFKRALEADPDNTEARVEFARLLEGAGRRSEAYEVLKVMVDEHTGSTAELERLATLALGAGRVDDAVALLQRALDRHPEDLALKQALENTEARQRDLRIKQLLSSSDPDQRLVLAGLYAEQGSKPEAMRVLQQLGKLDASNPDLSFLRFSAEHFARHGKEAKAEAALRSVARALSYQPGTEPAKEILYRVATLYERAGKRKAARRVFLEIYSQDPAYRDVSARLEVLAEDVRSTLVGAADERVLELVDVGAPLGTIFDSLKETDLSLDPKLLAQGRKSNPSLTAQG